MTLVRLPAAQANAGIAAMFVPSTTYYAGLCNGDPALTGANEVLSSYTPRPAIIFGSGSLGVESSTDAQTWTCTTGFTASYMMFGSTSTGGTYEGGTPLGASIVIPASALVTAAIAATTVAVQG